MMPEQTGLIPNQDTIFTKTEELSPADFTLRAREWAVLTQIDGNKSVSDIARRLSYTIEEATTIFVGLYERDLIKIIFNGKQQHNEVPHNFMKTIETELTGFIGPVAPFIIQDAMQEFEQNPQKLDIRLLPGFIENISDQIPENQKRIKFQEIMLNHLKGMNVR
ncbi:MAG: hypothetical protein GF313_11675 [Caldithrix sp.]|nr:hypothetical protein [Caldithrix sp.]